MTADSRLLLVSLKLSVSKHSQTTSQGPYVLPFFKLIIFIKTGLWRKLCWVFSVPFGVFLLTLLVNSFSSCCLNKCRNLFLFTLFVLQNFSFYFLILKEEQCLVFFCLPSYEITYAPGVPLSWALYSFELCFIQRFKPSLSQNILGVHFFLVVFHLT